MSQASSSTSPKPRVAVIGGGAIGLSIGWRLAAVGCQVDVFDARAAGRGASWAAAGMLAASLEAEPQEEQLLGLTRASLALWPDFVRELEAAAGMSVGYRSEGTMAVAGTRDEAERLRFNCEFQRSLGLPVEWLSGMAVREREPCLAATIVAGALCASDHQVDNRQLVAALLSAFGGAGGRLREHCPAALVTEGGRVRGIRAAGRLWPADVVVLAAGAWSAGIEGWPAAVRLPVRPVKGQMVMVQMPAQAPLLRHVVWAPKAYLVPRRDGRLLIGATVEDRGFDTTVTAGGVFALLDAAWRTLPGLEDLPIIETWAGLRPGSRDDAPILGASPVDGLIIATGHYRNGILLTPITAAAIAALVLTGRMPAVTRGFELDRFNRAAGSPAEDAVA